MESKKMSKKVIVKFIILLLIIAAIVYVTINYSSWFIEKMKNVEDMGEYIRGFGFLGFLIFILMQIIQVVIAIIPGDIVNFAGGFIYGIPVGFALSYIGIMLGTVIIFYISRFFGYEFVAKFISEEQIEKMSDTLNSVHGSIGLLIICLIPFLPKDLMIYTAGLTPIKASRLFIIYGISRIPGTLIWTSIGASVHEHNYLNILIVFGILGVIFGMGYLFRDKINLIK